MLHHLKLQNTCSWLYDESKSCKKDVSLKLDGTALLILKECNINAEAPEIQPSLLLSEDISAGDGGDCQDRANAQSHL